MGILDIFKKNKSKKFETTFNAGNYGPDSVWYIKGSSVYHPCPNCPNLLNTDNEIQTTEKKAIKKGLHKCKTCSKMMQ